MILPTIFDQYVDFNIKLTLNYYTLETIKVAYVLCAIIHI